MMGRMGMERNGMIKVVWKEGDMCHAVNGQYVDDDGVFLKLVLFDGTELSIAKSAIIKIEKSGRRGY